MLGTGLNLSASGARRKTLFSRASTATYIDANGVLQTAGVNVPRYQNGSLLVEAAATNLLLESGDVSNVAWNKILYGNWIPATSVVTGAPAPDGSTSACTVTLPGASSVVGQRYSALPNSTYTFSIWVKAGTCPQLQFVVAEGLAGSLVRYVAPLLSAAQYTGVLTRVFYTFSTGDGIDSVEVGLGVSGAGVGTYISWGGDLKAGSDTSSYIPTTSAPATRAADIIY